MISPEELRISPKMACRDPRLSRDGRTTSLPTFYRWITRGARSRSGVRVVLETVQTPSGKCTTREAIGRFIDALNADPLATGHDALHTDNISVAEKELRDAGIL